MKAIKLCWLLIAVQFTSTVFAQTPAGRKIHLAYQSFSGCFNEERLLTSDQDISPRVLRASNNPEKIVIMFLGPWIDITDEVSVSGTGVSFNRFVRKANNSEGPKDFSQFFAITPPLYNGAYCTVEFLITDNASFGTHTVKLKRPRFGPGKDETEFYIEVIDAVRIDCIKFVDNGESIARNIATEGESGTVQIAGKNLRKITGINSSNSWFSNISNVSILPNLITFRATIRRNGEFGYTELMSIINNSPGASHPQYPKGTKSQRLETFTYRSSLFITRQRTLADACPFFTSDLQLVAGSLGAQPNLQLAFEGGIFKSGDNLLPADISAFSLCPAGSANGSTANVTIPDLVLRITNQGGAASAPATITVCGLKNSNIGTVSNIQIPALGAGATMTFIIARQENRVAVTKESNTNCRRATPGAGVPVAWNDLGIVASVYTRVTNGRRADNIEIRN